MNSADLKKLVERPETRAGRLFELTIQTLIVTSLIACATETVPDLPAAAYQVLSVIEVITVCVFTFEYLLRLTVADGRLRFAFSFFGIIDLLAILPFYIALTAGMWHGADLRPLRGLRLFRLFRVFKLARYSRALSRFHRAFAAAREELVLYFILTLLLLYFAATGIYLFEHEQQPESFSSIFSSLWWAVATLTTVGYGDVYPVTLGGRLFTFFVLMIGLGVVSIPAGIVAAALEQARQRDEDPSAESPNNRSSGSDDDRDSGIPSVSD